MKVVAAPLKAHYALGTTTVARCWKCTRADGQVFAFTSNTRALKVSGVVYEPSSGMSPSAIDSRLDMSVANMEVAGFLDSASITEADVLGGLWDDAEVEVFEVNYTNTDQGRLIVSYGRIGNISTTEAGFNTEIRGLAQFAQQPVGGYYTNNCTANLGDARCKVDVESMRVSGAVVTVATRAAFTTDLVAMDDLYGAGLLAWVTGANAGAIVEVFDQDAAGNVDLAFAMPANVAAGDTFTIVPGCRKRRSEDCRIKFMNLNNFRGFPDVPLNDRILGRGGVN